MKSRMMACGLVLQLALASPGVLVAGPFGLEMGMKAADIKGLAPTKDPLAFDLPEPPVAHPLFNDIRVWFSSKSGLCGVLALTSTIDVNSFGTQAINQFEQIEAALTKKYGKPQEFKILQGGSIWDEANDWMMGLLKEERMHASQWKGDRTRPLPDNLQSIELHLVAINPSTAMLKIVYRFTNFADYEAEKKAQLDVGL